MSGLSKLRAQSLEKGCTIGLRSAHYSEIISNPPDLQWFETISENFMGFLSGGGGSHLKKLEKIRKTYDLVFHGVGLSIGSVDPLNWDYLKRLKQLYDRFDPMWVSDHLCWTGAHGRNLHDLIPVPFTEETLLHLVDRIKMVQEFLERPILLENVSSYFTYSYSEMNEWEFLKTVSEVSGCGILLDVNNIYVSSVNHGFDAEEYMNALPVGKVIQMHLAGYTDKGTHLIDTHDQAVSDPVWNLYKKAVSRFGPLATLIERDDNFPPLQEIINEARYAQRIQEASRETSAARTHASLA